MNTKFKKALALGLCAGLALTSLSGCSSREETTTFDGEATALTVNGETLSVGVINFGVRYSQSVYEDMYAYYFGLEDPYNYDLSGTGSTLGDSTISAVVLWATEAMLAEQKMEDYGVSLTDEDQEQISAAAAAFIEANDEEVISVMGVTQEIVERYLELNVAQVRMEAAMIADVDTEVSDEEAAQRRVEYVLITMETDEETEEETEAEETETGSEAADEAETGSEAADDAGDETAAEETETVSTEAETVLETEADEESETAALTEEDAAKTQSSDETDTEYDSEAADDADAETDSGAADDADAETDSEAADESEEETAAETETETETEEETEDEATRAAREEAYQKAMTMIGLVQSGTEFADAAAEIDEDLTVHEITFGSDDSSYSENLVNATEGLGDDTVVDYPVEASTGYYVVHVISQLDREATDERKEEIVEERQDERIDELYAEWEEDSEIEQDTDVLATIVFDYSLTQYVEEETETEAADSDEAESDEETEAESGSEAAEETETESGSEAAEETETESESEAAEETGAETETDSETETAETESEE